MRDVDTDGGRTARLRGPTKDYREFKGEYGTRFYSIRRIVFTNVREMISSRWAIAIIILSYLFLSFNLLGLVFGGGMDEYDPTNIYPPLEPDTIFKVEPIDGQEAVITVELGGSYSLGYRITNTGSETGQFSTVMFTPNFMWSASLEVEGEIELSSGESSIIRMTVNVPDEMEDFVWISGDDPFLSLRTGYGLDDGEGDYPGELDGPARDDQGSGPVNSIYSFNSTRAVTLMVAPTDLLEDIASMGISSYDFRIRTISTLFNLEADQTPDPFSSGDFGIDIEKGDDLLLVRMEAPDFSRRTVTLANNGDERIELVIEALIMPVYDPGMAIDPADEEQTYLPYLEIELLPGEKRVVDLGIITGDIPYSIHYNFILGVTETTEGSLHSTDAVHGIVEVTGSSYEKEKEGEKYHNILWGGGFNFERYLWIILLAAFAGSSVISNDLQENSISLYLSKPITWYDYLWAKFSSLFILLSTITILPAILLFTTGMAFSKKDIMGIIDNLYILGAMLISYMVAIFIFASVCMAVSSMVRKWIFGGVVIFVLFIFTSAISDILLELFKNDHLKLLNLNLIFKNLFRPLFGLEYNTSSMGMEWYIPVLVLVAIAAASWSIMVVIFRIKEAGR